MDRRDFLKLITGVAAESELQAAKKRHGSLRGSRNSLDNQNLEARLQDLTKIEDAEQLKEFVQRGLLVRLPENKDISVDPDLPEYRRYARPWTVEFLRDIGRSHRKMFRKSHALVVSSAVRPKSLGRVNFNASPRSTHPTGSTIDLLYGPMLGKNRDGKMIRIYPGLSVSEMKWLEKRLLALERIGAIEATKERKQPCYHIMVFKSYPSKKKGVILGD